ncbi:MAG: proline--tRNA ligase [Neisseriales bacterium]|nr:MAG: proline--tRNA ligase [Neisseriales bacterium]
MRASAFFMPTSKETPAEAELISHKLMLRAGLIKRVAAGIYTWMPLGLLVLRKVEAIVREEMNKIGAIELLMPALQPAELWQTSGRWTLYDQELLRLKDRHERDLCIGPTYEEVITDLVKKEIRHHKQLPLIFYQIQTKFRDEIRPRFGVMRAREFMMKDAYSFHADKTCLQKTYQRLYDSYCRIFTRIGFQFRTVVADTGTIGGSFSHEFQVLADTGEDIVAYCLHSDYAANIELAAIHPPKSTIRPTPTLPIQKVHTPAIKTIEDLSKFLHCPASAVIKSIVVDGEKSEQPVLLLLRGDNVLNEAKASKLPGIKSPLTFSSITTIQQYFGAEPGFVGPIPFSGLVYADYNLINQSDWITGANQNHYHFMGANFGRDCPEPIFVDLRQAETGDPSPCGKGLLKLARGIEVGHIFQLGTKYSLAMQAMFLNKDNTKQPIEMGCYGIGISRIVAAFIEQHHDEQGIIFNEAIAPFDLVIVPLGYHQHEKVRNIADTLYQALAGTGRHILLDDRNERAGILLTDSELVGIPHRFVVGERSIQKNQVEYQNRQNKTTQTLPLESAISFVLNQFATIA